MVGAQPLRALGQESHASGRASRAKGPTVRRGAESPHDRRMVPTLLSVLSCQAHKDPPQPVIEARALVQQSASRRRRLYANEAEGPRDGVVPKAWQGPVVAAAPHGQPRLNRRHDALQPLTALRERGRCKAIWLPGAQRARHPEDALPLACPDQRLAYAQALPPPRAAEALLATRPPRGRRPERRETRGGRRTLG